MKLDACDLHVFKDEGNLIIATHALTVSLKGGKSKKVTVCESCLSDVGNMFHLDTSTAMDLMSLRQNGPGQPRGQKPVSDRDGRLCPQDGIVLFGGQGMSSHYRAFHGNRSVPDLDDLKPATDQQKRDGIVNGDEVRRKLVGLMGDEEWKVAELYDEAVRERIIPKQWSLERGFRPFVNNHPGLTFTDKRQSLLQVAGGTQ